LDAVAWSVLAGTATGVITGAPFLRSTLVNTIVSVKDASQMPVSSGGSSTPGGATTQVQFNDAGAFNGVSPFTYDKATQILRVTSLIVPGNIGSGGIPVDTIFAKNLPNLESVAFFEKGTPPAAVVNQAVMYSEDNGSGKTRLMVRFPTGAAVQLAIEP